MKDNEIVIKISEDIKLSDAVCQAMNLKEIECNQKKIYQTVKYSQVEDKLGINNGLGYSVDGHSSVI